MAGQQESGRMLCGLAASKLGEMQQWLAPGFLAEVLLDLGSM